MFKTFGRKLNLESFSLEQLEDARNKLRTQIYQVRSNSNFNENVENDTLSQAQFMLDAIVSEIAERETIVDKTNEGFSSDLDMELQNLVKSDDPFNAIYDALSRDDAVGQHLQDMYNDIAIDRRLHPDDDFEDIISAMADQLEDEYGDMDFDPNDQAETVESAFASPELENQIRARLDQVAEIDPDNVYKIVADEFDMTEDELRDALNDEKGVAMEKAPPGAKYKRMAKHIKAGYKGSGLDKDEVAQRAFGATWKAYNKNESTETGEDMKTLREGEIQQASAIVTAKTMVDRVGRWIEELSGMENDTLLQLGDSIRDEMGQEQAKAFISTVAPAIQSALENLKTARETLASGVRTLTGEEQAAGMLGAETDAGADMGAEPDAMNSEPAGDEVEDEFAAAEPAAGGMETAGREQRESIERQNRLLKVLAG